MAYPRKLNPVKIQPGTLTEPGEVEALGERVKQAHHYDTLSGYVSSIPHDPRMNGAAIYDFDSETIKILPNTTVMESREGRGDLTPVASTFIDAMKVDDEIVNFLQGGAEVDVGLIQDTVEDVRENLSASEIGEFGEWWAQQNYIFENWLLIAMTHWGANGLTFFDPEDIGPNGPNETNGIFGCWGGLAGGAGADTLMRFTMDRSPMVAKEPVMDSDDVSLHVTVSNRVEPYMEVGIKLTSNWRGDAND